LLVGNLRLDNCSAFLPAPSMMSVRKSYRVTGRAVGQFPGMAAARTKAERPGVATSACNEWERGTPQSLCHRRGLV
jgi:hypothetical protein